MSKQRNEEPIRPVAPTGSLIHLNVDQVKPSSSNPRHLFDRAPLESLKQSIRVHGVLVPLTVYKLPGQEKYGIVDGERRYRSCVEISQEGTDVSIPANVVSAPDAMASLIYMFNIHSFREQWELMPTAIGLKRIIDKLDNPTDDEIHELTGLSHPQIRRCKLILTFPKKYQEMSLNPDPDKRIPSNFWIELSPILDIVKKHVPALISSHGIDYAIDALVDKYRKGNIKSVIHFRRISEAFEVNAEDQHVLESVSDRLREYILDPDLETRRAFDGFITDQRRVQKATDACSKFISDLTKASVEYAVEGKDREDLITQLEGVIDFTANLIDKLKSSDPPLADSES